MTYVQSHCGPNGFSPPAPNCEVHQVPEPATWLLILIALSVAMAIKGVTRGRR